jgi:hypothetical protein
MSELIGILMCLTENKAQYIVLIHNRMHSLKTVPYFRILDDIQISENSHYQMDRNVTYISIYVLADDP